MKIHKIKKCYEAVRIKEPVDSVNDWTGEVETEWVDVRHGGCDYQDISTHAMKCRVCGHVDYYSGAGKLVETKGMTLNEAMSIIDKEAKKFNEHSKPKNKKRNNSSKRINCRKT